MRLSPSATLVLAASGLLAAAGCAAPADPDAGYRQWLAHWRGATRELLIASWGPPQAQENGADGVAMIYVVRREPAPAGGGAAPALCTTRFLLLLDQVASATFSGSGCVAPGQAPG